MPATSQIEYKNFHFELKNVDEDQGIIEGYLSTFGNVDQGNDRVIKGAFKKTLLDAKSRMQNKGKKLLWPVLWMHKEDKPLGKCLEASEDVKGLYVKFWLDITTNDKGHPNNPLATTIFSGYKNGYVDEQSMGYKAIQKDYDGQGVRNLKEVQVWELSCVTSLFAMNDEAVVTSVKTASGGDFPLADRNTPWSKSKAIKDIEAVTKGDWSKASKYFFWSADNPTTEADHKFPFVAKSGGSMKAIPQAIISAAGVLRGAMGGAKGLDDVAGIKAKIASYYAKMGMQTPWSNSASTDKGKYHMPDTLETKDFNDYYRLQAISDWADKWSSLTCALKSAVLDAFNIGDQPDQDVQAALNGGDDSPGFVDALMDWIHEGIALNVSDYMKPDPYDTSRANQVGYTALGYMSRSDDLEIKKGAAVSKESAARLSGHADTLELAHKAIATVADDMRRYITGGAAPYGDSGTGDGSDVAKDTQKSRHVRPRTAPNANDQPLTSTDMDISDADLLEALQHAHF